MHVGRVGTVKQQEEPPVIIRPAPVELYQEAVRLPSGEKIVVQTNPLPGYKFVGCNIHTMAHIHPKQLSNAIFHGRQKSVLTQKCESWGKFNVPEAALKL